MLKKGVHILSSSDFLDYGQKQIYTGCKLILSAGKKYFPMGWQITEIERLDRVAISVTRDERFDSLNCHACAVTTFRFVNAQGYQTKNDSIVECFVECLIQGMAADMCMQYTK
jgi:hypothetical protein